MSVMEVIYFTLCLRHPINLFILLHFHHSHKAYDIAFHEYTVFNIVDAINSWHIKVYDGNS